MTHICHRSADTPPRWPGPRSHCVGGWRRLSLHNCKGDDPITRAPYRRTLLQPHIGAWSKRTRPRPYIYPRDIPGNVPLLIILTYPSPRWGLVSYMSCWGGGGGKGPPPEISQTTRPISEFQMPFDSPVRELPVQGQKFDPEVTDDVTGQVKVRILDFSGLVTSASKISMLSANKADESAWIVSLASVSIISCAVWP